PRRGGGVAGPAGREEHAPEVATQVRLEQRRTGVDFSAKRGLEMIELLTHTRVLRALARKHEDDRAVAAAGDRAPRAARIAGAQCLDGFREALACHRPPVREG